MTKKELSYLAAELDVPGRSKLSPDELAKAVTAAQRERKAAGAQEGVLNVPRP